MKYLIYLMLLLSLFACSSKQDMATVSGTVELNGSMTPDSILVGLYKVESQKFGELVDFTTTTNNAFTLHAKPGTYTLAAWAFGYENAKLNIFLPDVKSAAKASITLAQTALPEQIDKVSLVGDFNEWNWHEAVPMRKEAGLWKLDDTSVLDKEKSYKFICVNSNNILKIKACRYYRISIYGILKIFE